MGATVAHSCGGCAIGWLAIDPHTSASLYCLTRRLAVWMTERPTDGLISPNPRSHSNLNRSPYG